jgi:hypothetical protein
MLPPVVSNCIVFSTHLVLHFVAAAGQFVFTLDPQCCEVPLTIRFVAATYKSIVPLRNLIFRISVQTALQEALKLPILVHLLKRGIFVVYTRQLIDVLISFLLAVPFIWLFILKNAETMEDKAREWF